MKPALRKQGHPDSASAQIKGMDVVGVFLEIIDPVDGGARVIARFWAFS